MDRTLQTASAVLLLIGGGAVWRLRGGGYRAGPWPGLTPRGAGMLLGCAALLAGVHGLVGEPRRPWPDLVLLAITSLGPLLLATRVMGVPGAASAACGAYLLPRSLASLVEPGFEPPPLLLVPAFVLDLVAWARRSDAVAVLGLMRRRPPRRRVRSTRRLSARPLALGGAAYGAVLSVLVPPWSTLLGRSAWDTTETVVAGAIAAVLCGGVSLLAGSAPGTGSRRRQLPTG